MSDALTDMWTLTCGGVTTGAGELGVTDLVRRRVSQGTDVCLVHLDGTSTGGAPTFAPGADVVIARNGVTWFAGRVTAVPASGSQAGRRQVYRLSGPWWFLEQLVAQQQWSVRGGQATAWTSRLVVGQAADGSRLTTGQVLTQALQDAAAAGAPLQVGVVDPALVAPLDELRDVTCAQVVRAVLRWHPDCVAWFDYTTAPTPTWHCRQRGNLPAVGLDLGRAPVATVREITARHDLAVPAVVLNYEVGVVGTDGSEVFDIVTDAAPPGATGREPGAVVGTIPLRAPGSVTDAAAAVNAALGAMSPTGATGAGVTAAGLAAGLLSAVAAVPYGGSIVLAEGAGACGATGAGLGSVLNLTGPGAAADWATMRALVVEEEVRAATGTTTLRFGPGEGEEGLAAALRATRPGGVPGREAGSPGLAGTAMSGVRVSGRMTTGD